MAFHLFNLGSVGAIVEKYTDNRGFVPEIEDVWHDFQWSNRMKQVFRDRFRDNHNWQIFRENAISATKKAEQALLDLEFLTKD